MACFCRNWDKLKFLQENYFILQVYAANMTPENRQECSKATEPLLEAVDSLVTYASSPEFASVPAKISSQVFVIRHLFKMYFNLE